MSIRIRPPCELKIFNLCHKWFCYMNRQIPSYQVTNSYSDILMGRIQSLNLLWGQEPINMLAISLGNMFISSTCSTRWHVEYLSVCTPLTFPFKHDIIHALAVINLIDSAASFGLTDKIFNSYYLLILLVFCKIILHCVFCVHAYSKVWTTCNGICIC